MGWRAPTWIQYSVNKHVESNTKLHNGYSVQHACDPFVTPRNSISSIRVQMSKSRV